MITFVSGLILERHLAKKTVSVCTKTMLHFSLECCMNSLKIEYILSFHIINTHLIEATGLLTASWYIYLLSITIPKTKNYPEKFWPVWNCQSYTQGACRWIILDLLHIQVLYYWQVNIKSEIVPVLNVSLLCHRVTTNAVKAFGFLSATYGSG